MDKFKKFKGSMKTLLVVAVVMVIAGTLALLAAEKQDRGFLGVSVQSLDSTEREKAGVMNGVEVISVEKESAAAKAGIKEDDIIQLVNGEKIRDARDLVEIIGELTPGQAVKIGLWRDGKALEMKVTLGKHERHKHFVWDNKKMACSSDSGAYLGIILQDLNADLAAYFSVKSGEGVLIVSVEKDTAAEKAGLKAGDVIVGMGEKTIKNADSIHEVLADLEKGETIAITVIRHGKKETLKAEPDFNRHKRIFRIFRSGKDKDSECLEIPDMDIEVPEMNMEMPPLPDMPQLEETLHRVHEKLDQVKMKIEKRLKKTCENFWI